LQILDEFLLVVNLGLLFVVFWFIFLSHELIDNNHSIKNHISGNASAFSEIFVVYSTNFEFWGKAQPKEKVTLNMN
jgi:hypothetical protein